MRRRVTSGIVAAITAVALTVPAAGLANKGGKPHTTPPSCHVHKHTGKHKGSTNGKKNGSSKGNKCGQPARP